MVKARDSTYNWETVFRGGIIVLRWLQFRFHVLPILYSLEAVAIHYVRHLRVWTMEQKPCGALIKVLNQFACFLIN